MSASIVGTEGIIKEFIAAVSSANGAGCQINGTEPVPPGGKSTEPPPNETLRKRVGARARRPQLAPSSGRQGVKCQKFGHPCNFFLTELRIFSPEPEHNQDTELGPGFTIRASTQCAVCLKARGSAGNHPRPTPNAPELCPKALCSVFPLALFLFICLLVFLFFHGWDLSAIKPNDVSVITRLKPHQRTPKPHEHPKGGRGYGDHHPLASPAPGQQGRAAFKGCSLLVPCTTAGRPRRRGSCWARG